MAGAFAELHHVVVVVLGHATLSPGFDIPWQDFIVIEVGWLHGPAHVAWWLCIVQVVYVRHERSETQTQSADAVLKKRNFWRAITPCLAQPARISKCLAVSCAGVKVLVALSKLCCPRAYVRALGLRHGVTASFQKPVNVERQSRVPPVLLFEETRVCMHAYQQNSLPELLRTACQNFML